MYADSNGVWYIEETDIGEDFIDLFNAAQSGTSAVFGSRQRRTYVWTNQASREAQTGMVQGATGYQLDTKAEYKYENNVWRLATPHVEWNLSRTMGDSASFESIGEGNATVSAPFSSSTDFVADLGDGFFRIVDPGIYSFSMVSRILGVSSVGITELVIARGTADKTYGGIVATGGIFNDRAYGSVALPNIRLVTANDIFGFAISKRTGGSAQVDSTVRITRIG